MEDILGRDRLAPDARLGERQILWNGRVQVMADHQHVEVLVDRIDRERPRRVRARRKDVRQPAQLDDVRRVPAARALGVVRVDRAPADRRDRRLDETRLVQRVGVDGDLHIVVVGDPQRAVDRRRGRPPVLVQLEADRARQHLLCEGSG